MIIISWAISMTLKSVITPSQSMSLPLEKTFIDAIDQPYLKGYNNLKMVRSEQYNASSANNQLNRQLGLNQQGNETIRVSMYANKYPWEKARNLFGAVKGYGAQKINQ